MKIISFVVDGLPDHYFKAELLLFSLEKFGGHPKDQILVQCTSRVDQEFIRFLQRRGYRHATIEPFLDEKYCNKIPQLDVLARYSCEGVLLLDIDMFVLAPLAVGDTDRVQAKIVDAPNPPLSVLEHIFTEAGVALPEKVDTDWILEDGQTIATNFNGGLYYIPHRFIETLRRSWRKWATWLHARPGLFENDGQRNHIDQIAMAISLAETDIPCEALPANYNFPTHRDLELRTFKPELPISVLHYHWLISPFGLLDDSNVCHEKALESIATANHAIAGQANFDFFCAFKKAAVPGITETEESVRFARSLQKLVDGFDRRLKLVLHAGTPKTGTTSLQFFLDNQHERLLDRGILYPRRYSGTIPPKHQWLINHLLRADYEALLKELEKVLRGVRDDTHTVILSTEGIFNHWWDMTNRSRALLRQFGRCFDTTVWVWFRQPVSYGASQYQQFMKNPRIRTVPCYGRDISFRAMLAEPWFRNQFDYLGFFYDCESIFGRGKVRAFIHEGDTIAAACEELGLPQPAPSDTLRKNTGLTVAAIEMLRVINRYPLDPAEKGKVLSLVEKINEIVRPYSREDIVDEDSRRSIEELTSLMRNEPSLRRLFRVRMSEG